MVWGLTAHDGRDTENGSNRRKVCFTKITEHDAFTYYGEGTRSYVLHEKRQRMKHS